MDMRVLAGFIVIVLTTTLADRFEEELLVKDFGNGFSGLHFNFVIHKPWGSGIY